MTTAQALIERVEAAGGWLIPRGGSGLRVEAPAPLPDDLVAELRQHKKELLSLLAGAAPDKLGATWGHEVATLIRWFQSTTPPAERFELMPGVTIANPPLWWPTIAADIEAGPRVARGLTGAFAADLRRLYDRFGQAPSDAGADHGDDDIERAAIMEHDGQETAPADQSPAS